MKTINSNPIVTKVILMAVLISSSLLAQKASDIKVQAAIHESTIAKDLYNIESSGAYIPLISEDRELIYRGFKADIDLRYNVITDTTLIHGISIGGSFAAVMNNVHEFGGSISWGSFSTNILQPNKASYGWEAKLGFLYGFNVRYYSFAFNVGLETGPAIFNYKRDSENGELYYFYFIQPEIDFELRILEHFSLSFATGYVLHFPLLGATAPFVSHLTFGLTWRWYEID